MKILLIGNANSSFITNSVICLKKQNEDLIFDIISYKKIDKYIDLVRRTLDPDDYFDLEIQYDDDWQFIKIEVWDRVLH